MTSIKSRYLDHLNYINTWNLFHFISHVSVHIRNQVASIWNLFLVHVLVGLATVKKYQGLAVSLRWQDQDGWVLLRVCFLVCRQDGLTVSSHGPKTTLLSSFPYMGINDSWEIHPIWPHPNTISFWRPHFQTLPHWGLGIQHMN